MITKDEIIKLLIEAQIPSPRLEANIIIEHTAKQYPLCSKAEEDDLISAVNRRILHEPLDKILGYKEFYKYKFSVNENVLSPRPDTEILVEKALELIDKKEAIEILDLGTGSGCILLSILKECNKSTGVGVDISTKALEKAKENAYNLELEDRVSFINKSWQDIDLKTKQFDIIISNPPYIPTKEIEELDIEVKKFDPMLALDGGQDGLDCYKEIATLAPLILKKDGYILLEVGYNQAEEVAKVFERKGFYLYEIIKDLAGINRCVILKK